MKKIISVVMTLCLVISLCAGCGKNKGADYTGKEIAKLLLADERMNSSDLAFKEEADQFALFESTDGVPTYLASNGGIVSLDSYSGSSFQEECNMLEFFRSYTTAIESDSQNTAELIDFMKENIAFTDVWVATGNGTNGKTLLTVEANTETIFNDCEESLVICRRYTDENANDVYELFQHDKQSGNEQYLYYCPGHWYEMSILFGEEENADIHVVVENTRGYWNMFTVYGMNDFMNTQNLISTGDSTYVNFGTIDASGYHFSDQTVISDAGRNCDLITIAQDSVSINLAAFSGIASVETDADGQILSVTTSNGETIVPENMKPVDENAVYDPENVPEIVVQNGTAVSDRIIFGNLTVAFNKETSPRERVEKTLNYFAELGINCKYDKTTLLNNANNAYQLGYDFANYYSWNGYPMDSLNSVGQAKTADAAKHQVLMDAYEEIKDNKEIEMTEKGVKYLGYDFASVAFLGSANVTFEEGTVKVEDLKMTIENLDVMDSGEEYTVHLALAKLNDNAANNNIKPTSSVQNGGITLVDLVTTGGSQEADYTGAAIMSTTDAKNTTYESGNSFSLSQTAQFTLPQCTEQGMYTVVAYVATNDGIRVSEMVPVPFTSEVAYIGDTAEGFMVDMYLNNYKELIAVYSAGMVVFIPEETKESYTYAEVKELLNAEVLKYGLPMEEAIVEIYDPETDTGSPTNENQTFTHEICRIKYLFKSDNSERYIYIKLGEEQALY